MVAIITKSIVLVYAGSLPPRNTPRVELDKLPYPDCVRVKSPKSDALPADAIVTKSIVFTFAGATVPKPIKPRVALEAVPPQVLAEVEVKSPKSFPFPVVAKVINSIVLIFPLTGDG